MVLKRWTKEEDNILLEKYSNTTQEELAKLMDRTPEAIRKRGQRLNLHKEWIGKPKTLTNEEFLSRITYTNLTPITEYINRSTRVDFKCEKGHISSVLPSTLLSIASSKIVTCKVCAGKTSSYTHWGDIPTIKEDIKGYLGKGLSIKDISEVYNTTSASINHLISSLGLANTTSKFDKVWTRLNNICLDLGYEILNEEQVTDSHSKFQFKCNNNHYNDMLVKNFINKGYRCSQCSGAHSSQAEKEILDTIKSLVPKDTWIVENDRSILGGKELDMVLPDYGIAIEYNGIYWHSSVHIDNLYHYNKTNDVNDFGYQLIHIYEDDWLNKKDIIISRLSSIFSSNKKIYARNTKVGLVTTEESRDFFNTNHLQGYTHAKYTYGLFEGSELVACMSFSTPRFSTEYSYELVRFASKLNYTIVGGASKLLSHFKKQYEGSIISYSNRSWSKGALYKTLGFTYSHTSQPNYRYYKGVRSLSRYQCQKHLLKDMFPESYDSELTEKEIMAKEGYYSVYDSGNDVWVML